MRHVHILHYLVLAFILIGGTMTFWFVRPDTFLQLVVGIVTSLSYVLWGIIHHWLQKDLHQKIVVEYILIGVIAVILLATVLGT